ncbi:MAG: DUF4011 domain-containing protein [Nesterenkonia sp.]|nr:DUF4011 domain-containing protein [Nesterenkonia sp.]
MQDAAEEGAGPSPALEPDDEAGAEPDADSEAEPEAESESESDPESDEADEDLISAAQNVDPQESDDDVEHTADLSEVDAEALVTAWIDSLGAGAENDSLLRFTPSKHSAIDLTEANSSGLMQLMAGRKTRLSTMLIDAAAFETARTAAYGIRTKIRELSEERGIDAGHLAVGVASWSETTAAGVEQFTAPLMLVPVTIRRRTESDDFEVQFAGTARLNPALARHMAQRHDLSLDPDEFHAAGYATARLDQHRPAELLLRLAGQATETTGRRSASLASLQVWRHVYLSTFADFADVSSAVLDTGHPILGALASHLDVDQSDAEQAQRELPPSDERAPKDEKLVLDADVDQQEVLDAVGVGRSVVVSSPPGTGQIQTALNAAASLAWEGRRVLVVAERPGALEQFRARLGRARLSTLALHVPASASPDDLREQLVRAVKRVERTEPPRLAALHTRLTEARHQLIDHVSSLHHVRSRWECSPYQAMQALAALTSISPAPATPVRLKRSVLDNTVDRSPVQVKLRRAAELGSFDAATHASPWYGARLRNRQETDDAMELVGRLRGELPRLKGLMETAVALTGIRLGETFSDWHAQVLLFQRIQESLGVFSHDVYTKPVDDLIAATAPAWWRRDHGVEMSSIARSRLRRVAKEYVRPGAHVSDLHGALADVSTERDEWLQWGEADSLPSVPKNLDPLARVMGEVQAMVEELIDGLRLADPSDPHDHSLMDMPVEQMISTVEALSEDARSLETLPERTLLVEQLREQGFRDLLDDFAARGVTRDLIDDELELAWWQSALEAMISGDDYLAMTTGENLRSIEEEFRSADAAHIESGAQRLNHTLASRWKAAVEQHPEQAAHLRELMRTGSTGVADLGTVDPALTQPLAPILLTSPQGLSEHFPADADVDAVILLEAESLATAGALGAISRARQVVAFGDPVSGSPKPLQVSAPAPSSTGERPHRLTSIHTALSRVLPLLHLRRVHRGVDQELTGLLSETLYRGELRRLPDAAQLTEQGRRITVDHVAEQPPKPGARDQVDSPTGEVNRVVDMVFEHIRSRRDRSLAVITGSEAHAVRVADAVRQGLHHHAWARPFFARQDDEPFVVAPVERAAHIVRDDVVLSLGYGFSLKGEPAHHFGALSSDRGEELFATSATRAREHLRVVTSLIPQDLDLRRIEGGADLFMRLVDLGLRGAGNPTGSASLTDPLVLDLVDRIRARGGRVEDGFRGTLDLAACPRRITPEVPVTPLAMVSDGTSHYAEMPVRERSRQIPEAFARHGWSHMVLWTIEVFADPAGCTEVVAEKVGLGAGPEFAEHGRIPLGGVPSEKPSGGGRQVRFGGAADAQDEDSHRRSKRWLTPRERNQRLH